YGRVNQYRRVGDLRVCVFPGYRPKSICLAAPSARGTLADVSTAETTDQTPPLAGRGQFARWCGGCQGSAIEPTSSGRSRDSHRTTVEHNLSPGEAAIQIDHLDSKQADTGNPLYRRKVLVTVGCRATR